MLGEENATAAELMETGRRFFTALYGQTEGTSMSLARYNLYTRKKGKPLRIMALPSTEANLLFHMKRVRMQVLLWKAACRQGPLPFWTSPSSDGTRRTGFNHLRLIYTYSHYDILSDIMTILDHGNICVDTIFMIIIMHSFPDIEENLFFDNGGPHLHTHNMHIILQHFK